MKISIVTVSYNSANTIADTLHSVAIQTYHDIEHLVVDGGSTDDTVQVVETHNHGKLLLTSEPDQGIYDAMNKGFLRSTGEVIGFLNSDDFYADVDAVARIAKSFHDNPSVEACFGDLVYVSGDSEKVVRLWKSSIFENGLFARGWSPAHPTFYIRRSVLEHVGLFDLSYRLAADAEFMMRCLEGAGIKSVYIPHVLVCMRVGGATNNSWRNILLQNQEILRALKSNEIPYSLLSFVFYKLFSRLNQKFNGFRLRKTG